MIKNVQNKLTLLLFLAFVIPNLSTAQDNHNLSYEVHKIYPPFSITKEKLKEAKTLSDFKNETSNLNLAYDPSWVSEYIDVEILATDKGVIKKAVSKNNILSLEQKDLMNRADVGTAISVKIRYMPENNLSQNEAKEMGFTFTTNPESDATYFGGIAALKKYLKENAMDKIPEGSFKGYDLTTIKFTIGEEGEVLDVHLFAAEYPSDVDVEINELLLQTIREMPCWQAAKYANGTTVKQAFALTVGNMENCVVNLLNIRRDE